VFSYYQQRELHLDERYLQGKRVIFDSLILGLASPQQIQQWTQRQLPNGSRLGEVLHSKTVDYKTFKPLRDGLFCERIFGPVNDFKCSCGKQQPSDDITFCPECEVEYGPSTLRRRRLGYIDLFSAVTHIWYLKGRPNYIAVLLNKKSKALESLVYCTSVLVDAHHAGILPIPNTKAQVVKYLKFNPAHTIPVPTTFCCDALHKSKFMQYFTSQPYTDDTPLPSYTAVGARQAADPILQPDNPFSEMMQTHLLSREQGIRDLLASTGGDAVATLLTRVDLELLMNLLAAEIEALNPRIRKLASMWIQRPSEERRLRLMLKRRLHYMRRFKTAQVFHRTQKNPSWMTLSILPVLPPDLRPIMVVDEQVMASDLNRLYQRVLFRNNRMKRLRILDLENIGYTKRLLQEAVDALIENGKGGSAAVLGTHDKPLKSLSDRLKGKRGRFRQNLLGKRVDYSGRSVIVVGPKMQLHACGLPREMALELFYPFLIRRLLEKGYVENLVKAKRYLDCEHPIIWPILTEIMQQLPILLNRAPTLHRLGIQAFQPYLVAGQAILLHPLVCSAFNADFDGDQMAVHVPLSFQARAEAWKLLWSRNNLLAPATGQPILIPSQDMVLGCYYLTTDGFTKIAKADQTGTKRSRVGYGLYFTHAHDAIHAFYQDHVNVYSLIWLQLELGVLSETGQKAQEPKEIQVHFTGNSLVLYATRQERSVLTVSTQQEQFQESYTQVIRQYTRTTVGRILINSLLDAKPQPFPEHLKQRLERELSASGIHNDIEWDGVMKLFGTEALSANAVQE
jgi:DNA-directed RNA polymerase subunit beta'